MPMHRIPGALWRMWVSGAHGWTPKESERDAWAPAVKWGCCANFREVEGVVPLRMGKRCRVLGERMCILLGLVLHELHIIGTRCQAFNLSPAVIKIHCSEALWLSVNRSSNVH